MMLTVLSVAKVCHEANRAFCAALGDDSQLAFESAPDWQRTSAVNGVEAILDGRTATPSGSHDSWMKEKLETGWRYGPIKDPEQRTHPCLVPFGDLPDDQKQKDVLFFLVVQALRPLVS